MATRFEFRQTVAQWFRRAISQAIRMSWCVAAGSSRVWSIRAASSVRVHRRLIGSAYELAASADVKGQNEREATGSQAAQAEEGRAMAGLISRGFLGRRRPAEVENRLPPGQYLVTDFPVLSAGPTPHTPLDKWSFSMDGLVRKPVTWSWADFQKLPTQTYTVDISCVTKWTKLDTKWLGVSIDTLLEAVEVEPNRKYVRASRAGCDRA